MSVQAHRLYTSVVSVPSNGHGVSFCAPSHQRPSTRTASPASSTRHHHPYENLLKVPRSSSRPAPDDATMKAHQGSNSNSSATSLKPSLPPLSSLLSGAPASPARHDLSLLAATAVTVKEAERGRSYSPASESASFASRSTSRHASSSVISAEQATDGVGDMAVDAAPNADHFPTIYAQRSERLMTAERFPADGTYFRKLPPAVRPEPVRSYTALSALTDNVGNRHAPPSAEERRERRSRVRSPQYQEEYDLSRANFVAKSKKKCGEKRRSSDVEEDGDEGLFARSREGAPNEAL